MPEFTLKNVDPRTYLYVERSCSMDPSDIGAAMGDAFGEVEAFMRAGHITSIQDALSVYTGYDPEVMNFRAGFIISAKDAAKAGGAVKADQTAGGDVLYFRHNGSYAMLRDSYDLMMSHLAEIGRQVGPLSWEVYLNDPGTTPPAQLKTDVFVTLA